MNKTLLTLMAIVICTILPGGVHAQEEEPVLEQVVVTATRTEVPVEELGVSASVITSEEIERRQATDVLQLLRDVPGLNVTQGGSRGGRTDLYPRGGEDNFTLVLIDGVQVNEAGGGFDFSTLTTDNIERIEIIRGPQSALYGSDAMGGVIHIFTKRGKGTPTVMLSTAHGARNEGGRYVGEQKVGFSGGTENVGYSFAYGRIDDKGILDVNNTYYNNTFSGRLDFYPSETWEVALTSRVNDSRYEFPTELGGDRVDKDFPGLDPNQNQRDRDVVVGLQTNFDIFPWWQNVFQFGFHRLDQDFKDHPSNDTALDAPPGSWSDSMETRTTLDYHFSLDFDPADRITSTFTAGYQYNREDYDLDSFSTIVYAPPPDGSYPLTEVADENRYNNAFYLQEQISFFDRLFVTAGFRLDDNSEFGTEFSPKGSAAFLIKETGTKLRAAMGTAIKEPTFLENFGGFGSIGNNNLDPEKTFSWEAGVDQTLINGKLEFGMTYFWSQFKDLIATIYEPPIFTFENIQEAEAWGIESSLTARPGYGFTLGGNYTYLHTEVTDDGGTTNISFLKGQDLLRRPRHSASFYLDWLMRGTHLNLKGTYVGNRDDLLFTVSPELNEFGSYTYDSQRLVNNDYFVLDLVASYTTPVNRGPMQEVKIFLKGNNLLDDKYQDVLGYSSPRISGMGGVQVLFR